MRKLILNLHIYGGLLCFSYLILFGLSALNFNHPFEFTRARGATSTYERPIELKELPRITDDMTGPQRVAAKTAANNAVREALGLLGHPRPWQQSWWDANDPDHYHASIVHPGREYEIDVHLDRKIASVAETPLGIWSVIRELHGFHGTMPGSALISSWSWYTELCTFVVLFSGASGVYLWTRRKNERRAGLMILSAAGALSLFLMFYLTLHG